MRVIITRDITKLKQKIYKYYLKKQTEQYTNCSVCFRYWMILTFDFKFLKKIKKGEAYYIFILYILIFYIFCVKKK
ncbi:Uncharacterised protein [Enterococcus durans]|nr:Uncharacterised protein [Enterococcus durans]STQ48518.1 Uncharacterised protein [Enterococcus durans]STQ48530.1 Uncharacterised protein [Enterococcus durans]